MKMTLSSQNISTERQVASAASASDNRSTSPNSSPRGSPKPSPRPQTKKDHSRNSDGHLSVSYREGVSYLPLQGKYDGSPTLPDGNTSSNRSTHSANELSVPDFNRLDSTGSSCKDQKVGRTKKKSAWYNALYPTYKSRSEEFKRTFKDMPDDERLVVDYSCAMQKEILVQGRLYVTQNHLCFYANIFGWETNVTIKWRDVAAITKEKTALVIPNAVLVSTKSDKMFFTSFVARDKTYLMLFRIWQNALMDKPMTSRGMWHLVHQCYGDELGLTTDDEDYVAQGGDDEKNSGRFSLESYSEECASNADGTIDQLLNEEKLEEVSQPLPIRSTSNHRLQPKEDTTEMQLPTDMSDSSDSEGEKPRTVHSLSPRSSHDINHHPATVSSPLTSTPRKSHAAPPPPPRRSHRLPSHHHPLHKSATDPQTNLKYHVDTNPDPSRSSSDEKLYPVCSALHEGKQLMNEVIPMHVDQLFTLLFTPSKFFLDFHEQRKTTDLSQTEWSYNDSNTGTKTRIVNLTAALNQTVGPKTAHVQETQTMLACSKAGFLYSIDMETCNGGVPYADSFCILVHFCLHKISDNQSSIAVYAQIKYKKSVWGLVKGMIEKNCWQGLEDFYNALAVALQLETEETINTTEKRKVRIKQRTRSVQRTCLERPPNRSSITRTAMVNTRVFKSDFATIIVFGVLILLVILNILLYYKLWSLEESPPYSIMDLHLLNRNPPKSHEEWIKLLQQQEVLHTVEMQKWQEILKTAIKLLKQTEDSLNELQKSIHPTYTNKIMSVIHSQKERMLRNSAGEL